MIHICRHPYPRSDGGEQSEPVEMTSCACGRNRICPACGYGQWADPHRCGRIGDATHAAMLDESIAAYGHIWRRMKEGDDA